MSTGADDVRSNLAVLQFWGPGAGEGAQGRLRCAVCAKQGKSVGPVARGGDNDGAAVVHQWQCLLNGEIDTARVGIEGFDEMLWGDVGSCLESL